MKASIVNAARERVRKNSGEIKQALSAISRGKPREAEPDVDRRAAVVQVRRNMPMSEARYVARVESSDRAEAIWGRTIDFVDVAFLARGARAARSVCRIVQRNGVGIGTGFLIAPRLLITNNHVIDSTLSATTMLAELDYERDLDGRLCEVTRFALSPELVFVTDERDDLDYSVIALGPRVSGPKDADAFGWLPLSAARNKHAIGDFVNIIQHPDARLKEAVVRENQLIGRPAGGTVLHYVADTEPGASGSPVFNVMWNVVALHHWGGPHRGLIDESGAHVPRTVNEGIRASAIVADLQTRLPTLSASARALVEDALKRGLEATGPAAPPAPPLHAPSGAPSVTMSPDGTATWHIPLSVSIRIGGTAAVDAPSVARATDMPAVQPSQDPPMLTEAKLELDENYGNRKGYNPTFLKGVTVPLPKLSPAQRKQAAKNRDADADDNPYELKYQHFSILMNRQRRLAFYTATNIDGDKAKDVDRDTLAISDPHESDDEAAEASEQWFQDPRIEASEQTPTKLYAGQTAYDAYGYAIVNKQTNDHRNRMFQQGHLTRRQDPLWGSDTAVMRAHADTFHVTNRAPQVGFFNMGTYKPKLESAHGGGTLHWRALEDYVLNNARADRQRVTVFTGPIFDDKKDIPWTRDRADMKGFKAPLQFWKVVLRVEHGELAATALIADQSGLIDYVPENLSYEEAAKVAFSKVKKYHVSIDTLEKRTGLDFGKEVRDADTFAGHGEKRQVEVDTLEEVGLDRRSVRGKGNGKGTNGRARGGVAAARI